MTKEQFAEAEQIMNEIREIEAFLKVFKNGHRCSIVAYERGITSLDRDKEYSFQVRANGELLHAVASSMRKRIEVLNTMLEKI